VIAITIVIFAAAIIPCGLVSNMSHECLRAAIKSLFAELALHQTLVGLAPCDAAAAGDDDDSNSNELIVFLADTVQSSSCDDAFNVFACYVPSEHSLADVWPKFWDSVKRFSSPSSQTVLRQSALGVAIAGGVVGSEVDDGNDDDDDDACAAVSSADDDRVVQSSDGSSRCIALLRLDHMRRPKPYTRLISQWAHSLNMSGFLLFCNHLIIIFLSAKDSQDIARYLQLHRTQTVDVDSQGRPCREKMLTVLLQQQHYHQEQQQQEQWQQQQQQPPFRVVHAPTLPDAIEILTTQSAGAISRDCLKGLGFKV